MSNTEIEALVNLIDDDDDSVYHQVRSRLLQLGESIYDILQEYELRSNSQLQHERIKEVLSRIHIERIKDDLKDWQTTNPDDLLRGFYLVSKYRYPELELGPIVSYIDKMKLDIWLRLNYKFSPLDNVRIINEVFFGKYRFHGDNKNYYAPENSYLNLLVENRTGNPISLSILYSVVAQKLYLPIFGVDLPQHFILAYKDDSGLQEKEGFNTDGILPYDLPGEIIFYVNAFNGGAIFSRYNIDRFLKQSKLSAEQHYFEPCANYRIIARVLRNLVNSYEKNGDELRKNDVQELHDYLLEIGQ